MSVLRVTSPVISPQFVTLSGTWATTRDDAARMTIFRDERVDDESALILARAVEQAFPPLAFGTAASLVAQEHSGDWRIWVAFRYLDGEIEAYVMVSCCHGHAHETQKCAREALFAAGVVKPLPQTNAKGGQA